MKAIKLKLASTRTQGQDENKQIYNLKDAQ